jgi:hypothetical protein
MHYNLFTLPIEKETIPGNNTWLEKGFQMTDQLLEWCKANNMYLILDLHAAPGGQGNDAAISDYDASKPSLWQSEENQKKMIAFWRKMAERYANEPWIGGYDIINEPNWGFQNPSGDKNGCAESQNTPLWDLQKKITAAIREVDKNHIVIIEGNCWGNNYGGLPALWDNNMALSFHKYWNYNDVNSIQGIMNLRSSKNVPIWLGESGENSNTWFTNAIDLVETNKIGWAWWPLKKLGKSCPLEVPTTTEYEQVISYWKGNGAKPSVDAAYAALMRIADNLKLENTVYHKDVVDAMIRQPHTKETIPYTSNTISATPTKIFATEYDLGRNNIAYSDKDTANYRVSTNVNTVWNTGYQFRNDGVDIELCQDAVSNKYNVAWTEAGEWLQYSVNVLEEGVYTLGFRTAAPAATGKISIRSGNVKLTPSVSLPNTGGYQTWSTTEVKDVYLKKGWNKLRLHIENGGFNLNSIEFSKQTKASSKPKLMEGRINHNDKVIYLTYNLPLKEILQNPGFEVKVNSESINVDAAALQSGSDQIIAVTLSAAVSFGDTVKVTYTGDALASQEGDAVEKFSDQLISVIYDKKVSIIPGIVRAQDYSVNNGFSFEATSDIDGGQNAGFTNIGDYLDFPVLINEEGNYVVDYRVASLELGGKLKVQLVNENGSVEDLSSVTFNASGGWQTWITATGSQATLKKGFQIIRLLAETASFNINWMKFTYNPTVTAIDPEKKSRHMMVYPNPSNGSLKVEYPEFAGMVKKITIRDVAGKTVYTSNLSKGQSESFINSTFPKGLYSIILDNSGSPLIQKVIVE